MSDFSIAIKSFELPQTFISKFADKQPQWGELGYFTYKRTYARTIDGRTEEYWETCKRVVEGCFSIQKNHCAIHKLPWDERKAQRTAKTMYQLMWDFKFLPPGRGLWSMGTEHIIKAGGSALQNCAFVSTENIDQKPALPFMFLMDMSMVGVGVGFDTKGTDKLYIEGTSKKSITYEIEDSREGWVNSLATLIEAYTIGIARPIFDYSKIRKAGAPIKGFGGISSGPEPLIELHKSVTNILESRIKDYLTSTDIVDIMNMIGKCVVAGNVRRSAEIALGDPNDFEFLNLKQDQDQLNSHRWASNNSIFAEVGMHYSECAKRTAYNGEPGYFWLDNARAYGRLIDGPNWKDKKAAGCNPCSEQTLESFELCNLVESFPSRHDSLEEYLETLKIAYLYAKTVTLVPTHWEASNAVMMRNRRIGLSQSGIMRAFNKHGRREMLRWCDIGYKYIDSLDTIYSDWLCIPRSIKKTSVKPSGTVSLLPGEPPGIHYPHSEYYIRRIRLANNSPLLSAMQEAGYDIEPCVGQENSTVVIAFPVQEVNFERSKYDASIWEQVYNAISYQRYWADNMVSITVTFKAEERDDIEHILEMCEDSLKSISFLPLEDHKYAQAPYETITAEKYYEMKNKIKPIKFDHQLDVSAPKFCDGDSCEI